MEHAMRAFTLNVTGVRSSATVAPDRPPVLRSEDE